MNWGTGLEWIGEFVELGFTEGGGGGVGGAGLGN